MVRVNEAERQQLRQQVAQVHQFREQRLHQEREAARGGLAARPRPMNLPHSPIAAHHPAAHPGGAAHAMAHPGGAASPAAAAHRASDRTRRGRGVLLRRSPIAPRNCRGPGPASGDGASPRACERTRPGCVPEAVGPGGGGRAGPCRGPATRPGRRRGGGVHRPGPGGEAFRPQPRPGIGISRPTPRREPRARESERAWERERP